MDILLDKMATNYSRPNEAVNSSLVDLSSNNSLKINANDPASEHLFDITYRIRVYLSQPPFIIALTLALVAITFNSLSIMALFQMRNRLNTHYRLIISLAISDVFIGLSILAYILNKVLNPSILPGSGSPGERIRSRCPFMVIKAMNTTALNISLLNLMGMSVDHYLAITKPLRYQELMGQARTSVMILLLWLLAIFCGFSDFLSPILLYLQRPYTTTSKLAATAKPYTYNYCELIWLTDYQEEYTVLVIAFLCLVVMLVIYIRIYILVRRHKSPGYWNPSKEREAKKNNRALITTLLILGSFIFCWLPTCLFQVIMIILVATGSTTSVNQNLLTILRSVDKYLLNILLLNCICDPIIYTIRCKEVRIGYKRLFERCCTYSGDEPLFSCRNGKNSSGLTASTSIDKNHGGTNSLRSLKKENRNLIEKVL